MRPTSRFPKFALRLGVAVAVLAGVVFAAAFVMILWSDPGFASPPDVSPEALAAAGISFEQPYPSAVRSFRMRDGTTLRAQYLAAKGGAATTTIVYVHGLLGSSFLLNRSSGLLRETLGVESTDVVAIDLRGHGTSTGTPGDVDYIGQYEDDLGDVVREIRSTRAGGRVILAGHSMGGGISLRYAMRQDVPPVDGYVLFAPYLGWESPTTRKEATPEAEKAGARFMQIHLPRILGLKLLNAVGITAFNGLRVEFFNMPPEMPLRSYSYRAMENGAPADYRVALAAVRAPLLVVVGSRDEAFIADAYETAIRGCDRAAVTVVPDATHESVLNDARTMTAVTAWAAAL